MANQTSVLDINVNYQEFLEYLAAVREYRELLDKSGKELAEAVTLPQKSVSEREKASKNEAHSSKELVTISHNLTTAEATTNKERKEGNRQLEERKRLQTEEGRVQKENIKRARSFASSPLGKIGIGALSTAFSIKGAMKAFGALKNLSQSGLDIRTRALRTGMDAGHIKAWENNLQPYDPEGAIMDMAIRATRDAGTAAQLRGIGVDTSSGDVNKIMASMIPAMREFERNHKGENEEAIWAGRHLEQLHDPAISLEHAGDKEVRSIPGQVDYDAALGRGGISNQTLKAHQDAALAAGRLHNNWEAKKLTITAPMADKVSQEEEKFQEKLDDLASAAEDAALKLSQLTGGMSILLTVLAPLLGPSLLKMGGKGLLSLLTKSGSGLKTLWQGGRLAATDALTEGAAAEAGSASTAGGLATAGTALSAGTVVGGVAAGTVAAGQNQGEGTGYRETAELYQAIRDYFSSKSHNESHSAPPPSHAPQQRTYSGARATMGQDGPSHAPPPSLANAGVPDLDRLTGAVAMAESGGNPNAHSGKGAMGLMQLMPATARAEHVINPYDARQSWEAGERMLKRLSRHYHGDTEKALAAYNWGSGNLDRDIRERGTNWKQGLPRETADYIPRVLQNLARGTVVKIENYSGQNISVAARQASVL